MRSWRSPENRPGLTGRSTPRRSPCRPSPFTASRPSSSPASAPSPPPLSAWPRPALAATTGGAPMTQAAVQAKSAPFTIGFSDLTVKPGPEADDLRPGLCPRRQEPDDPVERIWPPASRSTASPPSRPRRWSRASTRQRSASPPRRSPASTRCCCASATVRSPPATPFAWSPQAHPGGRSVQTKGCAGIGFSVLHNDRAGTASLPAGTYRVSSPNIACGTASADFAGFLARAGRDVRGWTSSSTSAGRATFSQPSSGLSFSVAKQR